MFNSLLAVIFAVASPSAATITDATVGDLHVIQSWSNDPEEFKRQWAKKDTPNLPTSNEASHNKPITLFIVLKGCRADAQGNCNVMGSLKITPPNDLAYGEPIELTVWKTSADRPSSQWVMSPSGLTLSFNPDDAPGRYVAHLDVTDTIAGVTASSDYNIFVRPGG